MKRCNVPPPLYSCLPGSLSPGFPYRIKHLDAFGNVAQRRFYIKRTPIGIPATLPVVIPIRNNVANGY